MAVYDQILGAGLEDILLIGFIDPEDTTQEFYPSLEQFYMRFSSGLFCLRALHNEQGVLIDLCEENNIQADLSVEEQGCIPCSASVAGLILRESVSASPVTSIEVLTSNLKNEGRLEALALHLENDQVVFVDPVSFNGIRLGGEAELVRWKQDLDNVTSRVISSPVS